MTCPTAANNIVMSSICNACVVCSCTGSLRYPQSSSGWRPVHVCEAGLVELSSPPQSFESQHQQVLRSITKSYEVRSMTKYHKVLQNISKYYEVLRSTTKYYEVQRSTTKYHEVLRSTSVCVFVFGLLLGVG